MEQGTQDTQDTQDTTVYQYVAVRKLVEERKYAEAVESLAGSNLPGSTKEQLTKALESGDDYVVDRVFEELDARVAQALCWSCWGE